MSKLMTIGRYIEQTFEEGSRPDPRTVKSWIERGIIRGRKIGRDYFVYPETEANSQLARRVLGG